MKRILLVDDEPLVIVTLKSLFNWESYGFKIIMSCKNGEEALNYTLHHKDEIDIIICDVDMPIMNGIELGEELRRHNINVAIVFLSAYSNYDYVRSAFQNGACDYLLKSDLDESKILKVLNSINIDTTNSSRTHIQDLSEDRNKYIHNIISNNTDDNVSFKNCKFETQFPLSLLFIRINEFNNTENKLEIKTIIEGENVDLLFIDWQYYFLILPPTKNIKAIINRLSSNLWNYMDLSFDYKVKENIIDEDQMKTSILKIYNDFHLSSRLVYLSRKYIKNNYKNPSLNLTQISNAVGISKSHLSREYSKETGETIVEYISRIRINEAKKLLSEINLKTYEIAELTGFSNPETFFRTFKKVCGITPKQYQKK
ncbi:MAG: response regulator [Sphaerochaetaceae bacterium]|nr:response regulator [Sphaerochaetaceae bacterium]